MFTDCFIGQTDAYVLSGKNSTGGLVKSTYSRDLHSLLLHTQSHMVASTDGFMRGEEGKVD